MSLSDRVVDEVSLVRGLRSRNQELQDRLTEAKDMLRAAHTCEHDSAFDCEVCFFIVECEMILEREARNSDEDEAEDETDVDEEEG